MYVPNLATLGQICHDLSRGQAHVGVHLSVNTPDGPGRQGLLSRDTIPCEKFQRYTFVPNVVILGQICREISCRQAHFLQPDRQTDRQTDADDNTP